MLEVNYLHIKGTISGKDVDITLSFPAEDAIKKVPAVLALIEKHLPAINRAVLQVKDVVDKIVSG